MTAREGVLRPWVSRVGDEQDDVIILFPKAESPKYAMSAFEQLAHMAEMINRSERTIIIERQESFNDALASDRAMAIQQRCVNAVRARFNAESRKRKFVVLERDERQYQDGDEMNRLLLGAQQTTDDGVLFAFKRRKGRGMPPANFFQFEQAINVVINAVKPDDKTHCFYQLVANADTQGGFASDMDISAPQKCLNLYEMLNLKDLVSNLRFTSDRRIQGATSKIRAYTSAASFTGPVFDATTMADDKSLPYEIARDTHAWDYIKPEFDTVVQLVANVLVASRQTEYAAVVIESGDNGGNFSFDDKPLLRAEIKKVDESLNCDFSLDATGLSAGGATGKEFTDDNVDDDDDQPVTIDKKTCKFTHTPGTQLLVSKMPEERESSKTLAVLDSAKRLETKPSGGDNCMTLLEVGKDRDIAYARCKMKTTQICLMHLPDEEADDTAFLSVHSDTSSTNKSFLSSILPPSVFKTWKTGLLAEQMEHTRRIRKERADVIQDEQNYDDTYQHSPDDLVRRALTRPIENCLDYDKWGDNAPEQEKSAAVVNGASVLLPRVKEIRDQHTALTTSKTPSDDEAHIIITLGEYEPTKFDAAEVTFFGSAESEQESVASQIHPPFSPEEASTPKPPRAKTQDTDEETESLREISEYLYDGHSGTPLPALKISLPLDDDSLPHLLTSFLRINKRQRQNALYKINGRMCGKSIKHVAAYVCALTQVKSSDEDVGAGGAKRTERVSHPSPTNRFRLSIEDDVKRDNKLKLLKFDGCGVYALPNAAPPGSYFLMHERYDPTNIHMNQTTQTDIEPYAVLGPMPQAGHVFDIADLPLSLGTDIPGRVAAFYCEKTCDMLLPVQLSEYHDQFLHSDDSRANVLEFAKQLENEKEFWGSEHEQAFAAKVAMKASELSKDWSPDNGEFLTVFAISEEEIEDEPMTKRLEYPLFEFGSHKGTWHIGEHATLKATACDVALKFAAHLCTYADQAVAPSVERVGSPVHLRPRESNVRIV